MSATTSAIRPVAAAPSLTAAVSGERLTLAAAGAWTVEHAPALERLVEAASRERHKVPRVAIDLAGVERLDTFGAWLIERLARALRSAGFETGIVGLADHYRGLLGE